ncbi:hypothetical protein Bcep18194_C7172 [Burkholderia lata]|uniref:Uncharacterized protein n=1 Tax=Burkholderia lata (strain ATCC 17760 / DSM 23089 / LMG 22485 / NCIMB 9086 / R18194 / 383) TaxID=482957 RepID=Q39MV0_BURL3|nr:hypothetical protein Bcep18194_C7172 [Burkholderia lata]
MRDGHAFGVTSIDALGPESHNVRPNPPCLVLLGATLHSKFGRIMRHDRKLLKATFFIDCKIQYIQCVTLKIRISQTISRH